MLPPEKLGAPRFLVVGGDGLIGRGLVEHWSAAGESVLSSSRKTNAPTPGNIHFDLSAPEFTALPSCQAAVICAGITSLDQCHRHPESTRQVNVTHTLELVSRLANAGAFVIYLSTNLVFDGSRPMRKAGDDLCPMTEYGRQKVEVEKGMGALGDRGAIVRLTKVFHPGMPLLTRWAADFKAARIVEAFINYYCSPIKVDTVVAGIARVATEKRGGIWQFSGPVDVSYASIAVKVRELLDLPGAPIETGLVPDGKMEHNPANTTLDPSRAIAELGLEFAAAGNVLETILQSPS